MTDFPFWQCSEAFRAGFNIEEVPTRRFDVRDKEGLAPVIIEGAETAVLRGVQMKNTPQS